MKWIRLAIAILAIIAVLFIVPHLKAGWNFLPVLRSSLPDQGYGWVLNDLEKHTTAGHKMRNEEDPGNWAHELIHQINSDLRNATPEKDNAFYTLRGQYMRLATPNVTLEQVAAEVPVGAKKSLYYLYLVEARQWWDEEPLYVLDEAVAYATGLQYHVESETKDKYRLDGAKQFIAYSQALLKAVEKNDSDYKDMAELKQFVAWNNSRIEKLVSKYQGDTDPYDFTDSE